MRSRYFTKHYTDSTRVSAAVRHHWWLVEHALPLRLPTLGVTGPYSVSYQWIEGRPARPKDLPRLAQLLGNAHGAAWTRDLHAADLCEPHRFEDGTAFADYVTPRRAALQRRLEQGHLPGKAALHAMWSLLDKTAEGPAVFYKDSNPRNFLITETGTVFTIDTDDLTLAPPAYDLAKLVTTLVMTYGPLRPTAIDAALVLYNEAAARHNVRLGGTDRDRLDDFLALHAVLTAPYLGRHGYLHSWPADFPRLRG
ncbi:phosphotransferase family enzyme [Streptomyces sp. TLI_55]|uniref:phosphotransferase n=1 Tax=Streptomyces sp. TLI_55 TaxID=1938861 RepID=UPI000BCCF0BC|nr:phosphotransferase [Streptomyces sp. TLI_55]SNX88519.1 phosphotransferase family enzyme [Streptomyces sp. TLI_55]